MILIYETLPIDKGRVDKTVDLLVDRYSPFFIDEGSITFTTEANPKLLVEVVNKYNVFLFYTNSLEGMKKMGFSLKEIGELIMQLFLNPKPHFPSVHSCVILSKNSSINYLKSS